MRRTLECRDMDGRHVVGLYEGGRLVCEVKGASSLADGEAGMSLIQTKAIDLATRTSTGLFSIMGVQDSTRDRIHPPAFTKTIQERVEKGKKVRFLWNHDQLQPPIATVKSVRTVPRDGLPSEVLAEFPEASGGVEVTREYHDFALADAVFKNLASEGLNEMSFGFIPVQFSFTKESEDDPLWKAIRELMEVKLYEISDVQWGANPATMAVRGGSDEKSAKLPDILDNWRAFVDQLKSSSDLSPDQRSQMREGYTLIQELFARAEDTQPTEKGAGDATPKPRPDTEGAFSLQMTRAKALIFDLE